MADELKQPENKLKKLLWEQFARALGPMLRNDEQRSKMGLLSVADSSRRRSFSNPEQVESFNKEGSLRLEEKIKLQHLNLLMKKFNSYKPPPIKIDTGQYSPSKFEEREPGALNVEEFIAVISKVLGTKDYNDQLERLFDKLDTSADGYVDWNEFATYMLLQYRENDYMRTKKLIPFLIEPKIRHILNNRQEPTCRVVALENPVRYVTVSKEGAISSWTPNLHLAGSLTMTQEETNPSGQKRRFSMWVTDACYLPNVNKIAIASTSRDIRFYDVSTNKYFEEFHLYSLPDVPYCLTYWFDRKNPGNESVLIFGMDSGAINLFYFMRPINKLFETPFQHTTAEGVTKIFIKDLYLHSKCVRQVELENIHPDIIRKVMYLPENDSIISSSASARNSLVVMDVQRKNKPYIFKISKGVECFDYNKNLNALVTGSADHNIRLWNPYVPSKAVAFLQGHTTGVVDVVIHEDFAQVFSYSRDAVVKVWDLKEHSCLQTVVIKFPSTINGHIPEHGPFPLHLQAPPNHSLVVTCNDYISILRLGQVATQRSDQPTTHRTQLCCAIYNPFYKQVVTGADDSTIATWDVDTGSKALVFTNAHGDEEITCMVFDDNMRRLITGARNGSIKVWNFQNGHNLHKLESIAEAEITGIVPFSDMKIILAVGWNRLITKYDDSDGDNMYIEADTSWKGGQVHQEDILAIDFCPPYLLATASFDSEIVVWSMDTEKLFLRLRKGQPMKISNKMKSLGADVDQRPGSRNSRPNSRHRATHRPDKGQPAPVDKLLFLKKRLESKNLESASLISSEAGVLRWWSIYGKKHELGFFYASDFPEESVLGMCTDPDNKLLITGDTQGHITMWDIKDHCLRQEERRVKTRPPILAQWRGHDSAIVSIEYVEYEGNLRFVLTASTDQTARLWSLEGHYVGTFGQKETWNLEQPKTWMHPKTPWTVEEPEPISSASDTIHEGDESQVTPRSSPMKGDALENNTATSSGQKSSESSKEVSLNNNKPLSPIQSSQIGEKTLTFDEIPTLERGETLTEDDLPSRMDMVSLRGDDMDWSDSAVSIKRASKPIKAKSVTIDTRRNRIGSSKSDNSLLGMPSRARTFAFGSSRTLSAKSLLGEKAEKEFVRKIHDRQERRDHFGEIDIKQTARFGKLCSPYQALATKDLEEVVLPPSLPSPSSIFGPSYGYGFENDEEAEKPTKSSARAKTLGGQKLPAINGTKSGTLSSMGFSDTSSRRSTFSSHS